MKISVFQRGKNGTYYFSCVDPKTGRHICRSLKTVNEAVARNRVAKLSVRYYERGELSPFEQAKQDARDARNAPIFREAVDRYKKTIASAFSAAHVYNREKDLQKFFAAQNVTCFGELTTAIVQQHIAKMAAAGMKPWTIYHHIGSVKAFVHWCVKSGVQDKNPIGKLFLPRLETKPPAFLTIEQARRLLDLAQPPLRYMVALALYTGIRAGEMLRLRWEDFDWTRKNLMVRRTKTGVFRTIPFRSELAAALAPIRAKTGALFSHVRIPPHTLWYRLRKEAGFPRLRWHDLRHTYASNLVMAGADLPTVQALLGHANIETTMIYSHINDAHKRAAVDRLRFA